MKEDAFLDKTVTLLLLSLLEQRDMHGYEIIESLRFYPKNVFVMSEGSLYPRLHRLEQAGFVKSYRQEKRGQSRRYYQLTISGLLELDKEESACFQSLRAYHQVMRVQNDRRLP